MKQEKLATVTHPEWGKHPVQEFDVARYISPEHVARERECLWPNTWQVACREEEIPNPGDYHEYEIADQSLLVTRTPSGQIKAYFNACLHRGTQLAKGCGHVREFMCPFHNWRWSLDGDSRFVLDKADFPGMKAADLKLPEAQVGQWGGFVFVKLTEGGPAFDDYIKPVADGLAPYELDQYRIRFWKTTIMKCNWKTALEAFEEVYHTLGTHPQIMKGMDDVGTDYELLGEHSRMIVTNMIPSARYKGNVKEREVMEVSIEGLLDFGLADDEEATYLASLAKEGKTTRDMFLDMTYGANTQYMPKLDKERFLQVHHYTIFPNICFNQMAGAFVGLLSRPNGNDPDSCIFDVICLQHPAGKEIPTAKRETVTDPNYNWGVVMAQDQGNLELMQKGFHQMTLKKTRLAGYQERRLANRHNVIDTYYERFGKEAAR